MATTQARTCTGPSGATKAHDWMVSVLGPLFCTAKFCVFFLFLQAYWETEAHFTATGMQSQQKNSDIFRFRRAAIYQSFKTKVGLAAAVEMATPCDAHSGRRRMRGSIGRVDRIGRSGARS